MSSPSATAPGDLPDAVVLWVNWQIGCRAAMLVAMMSLMIARSNTSGAPLTPDA